MKLDDYWTTCEDFNAAVDRLVVDQYETVRYIDPPFVDLFLEMLIIKEWVSGYVPGSSFYALKLADKSSRWRFLYSWLRAKTYGMDEENLIMIMKSIGLHDPEVIINAFSEKLTKGEIKGILDVI